MVKPEKRTIATFFWSSVKTPLQLSTQIKGEALICDVKRQTFDLQIKGEAKLNECLLHLLHQHES